MLTPLWFGLFYTISVIIVGYAIPLRFIEYKADMLDGLAGGFNMRRPRN